MGGGSVLVARSLTRLVHRPDKPAGVLRILGGARGFSLARPARSPAGQAGGVGSRIQQGSDGAACDASGTTRLRRKVQVTLGHRRGGGGERGGGRGPSPPPKSALAGDAFVNQRLAVVRVAIGIRCRGDAFAPVEKLKMSFFGGWVGKPTRRVCVFREVRSPVPCNAPR